MKNITLILIATVILGFSATLSAEESINNFALVNKTGYVISHVFVSPASTDDWGEDVMSTEVLGVDETLNVTFSPKAYEGLWDVKVIYADDESSAVWTGFDLSEILSITIHYNRKTDETSAEVETVNSEE